MSLQWTAHQIRVTRLYRHCLKNLQNWTVHRELFVTEGFAMREQFERNRALTDARLVEYAAFLTEELVTGIADDNQRQRIKIFQVGDFFILDSKNRYLNILCIIRQDGT